MQRRTITVDSAMDPGTWATLILAPDGCQCRVTRRGHCRRDAAKAGSRKASKSVTCYEVYHQNELKWLHEALVVFPSLSPPAPQISPLESSPGVFADRQQQPPKQPATFHETESPIARKRQCGAPPGLVLDVDRLSSLAALASDSMSPPQPQPSSPAPLSTLAATASSLITSGSDLPLSQAPTVPPFPANLSLPLPSSQPPPPLVLTTPRNTPALSPAGNPMMQATGATLDAAARIGSILAHAASPVVQAIPSPQPMVMSPGLASSPRSPLLVLHVHELFPGGGQHRAILQSVAALSATTFDVGTFVGLFRDRLAAAAYNDQSREALLSAMRFGAAYEAFSSHCRRCIAGQADRSRMPALSHDLANALAGARHFLMPAYADRVSRIAASWEALFCDGNASEIEALDRQFVQVIDSRSSPESFNVPSHSP